jgi:AcrR family transcriptional regulator
MTDAELMAKTPASDTPPNPAPRRKRLGGRSARVKQAVIDATLALLSEKGLHSLTVADIAARAGVHETSIYRRWGQPANLIIEASLQAANREIPLPDTGSLAGDLVEMHKEGLAFFKTPVGATLIGWAFSAPQTAEINPVLAGYWRSRSVLIDRIFERARARGEWTSDKDIQSLLPDLLGPLYFRHFFQRQETTAEDLEALVATFLKGART